MLIASNWENGLLKVESLLLTCMIGKVIDLTDFTLLVFLCSFRRREITS
jgi:hypothetical protein